MLKRGDGEAIAKFFEQAKQRRDLWLRNAPVAIAGMRIMPCRCLNLIEIVPLDKPVQAQITVPGSKSITNRALILAALSEGRPCCEGALWSEDTQVMVECLQNSGS